MADVLRTRVTGPVLLPDGSAAPNGAKLIFTLRGWDKQDGALIMRGPQEALVIDGAIDVNLQRTAASDRQTLYDVSYTYFNAAIRNWDGEPLGSISLAGPGPLDLADILALPAPVPNVPDALAQALGAAASSGADAVQTAEDRAAAQAAQIAAEQAAAEAVNAAPWSTKDAPSFMALPNLVTGARYRSPGEAWDVLAAPVVGDFVHPTSGKPIRVVPVSGAYQLSQFGFVFDGVTDNAPANAALARAMAREPLPLIAPRGTALCSTVINPHFPSKALISLS